MEFNPMFDDQREEQENQFTGEMSAQQSENPVAPIENSNQEENLVLKWMINVPQSKIETELPEAEMQENSISENTDEVSFEWDIQTESAQEFSDVNTDEFVAEEMGVVS
ncbi:MAG: hypothetical protein ACRCYO_01665, partial [Bacteroidia bacterium]